MVESARPEPAQSCQPWLGFEDFILGDLSKGVTSSFSSQRSSDSWDEPGLCLESCVRRERSPGLEMTVGRAQSHPVTP